MSIITFPSGSEKPSNSNPKSNNVPLQSTTVPGTNQSPNTTNPNLYGPFNDNATSKHPNNVSDEVSSKNTTNDNHFSKPREGMNTKRQSTSGILRIPKQETKPLNDIPQKTPATNRTPGVEVQNIEVEDSNSSQNGHALVQTEPTAEVGEIEEHNEGSFGFSGDLLPPVVPELSDRKCLVLDLDETLVHSSFKYIWNADFVIPVEIEGTVHDVYVLKRPGVDEFLERVSELYEVVVFTASVAKYGDPLLDRLDPNHRVHHRLFRESCFNFHGNYIKHLSWLGRKLESVVIVDNSPAAYVLQPSNAVPVSSWFSDIHDNELLDMLPFLIDLAGSAVPNVLNVLGHEW